MSERSAYPPGVPCWVAAVAPDPEREVAFYTQLFSWQSENLMPSHSSSKYFMCRLRGHAVAAVVSQHGSPPTHPPSWTTHIAVADLDDSLSRVNAAGGSILSAPYDSPAGGRLAVVADSAGAVFSLWAEKARRGAELVNEPGAWAMSLLNTPDPMRARQFYGAVFGWQRDPFGGDDSPLSLWRLPGYVGGEPQQPVPRDVVGVMVAVGRDQSQSTAAAWWGVDFRASDVDATAERAAKLGGQVHVPPHDAQGTRLATLADPNGSAFSISHVGP